MRIGIFDKGRQAQGPWLIVPRLGAVELLEKELLVTAGLLLVLERTYSRTLTFR